MDIEQFSKLEAQLKTRFLYKLKTIFTDYNNERQITISLKLNEPLDSLYKEYLKSIFETFKKENDIKLFIVGFETEDPQGLYIRVRLGESETISSTNII